MGLTLDQDRYFRRDVRALAGPETSDNEESPFYRFAGLFRERKLKFELSDEPPPELVRRVKLDHLINGDDDRQRDSDWDRAEHVGRCALDDARMLTRVIRGANQQLQIGTTNLLSGYVAETCTVSVYPKLIGWAAEFLGVEERGLANVAFLHATVYAIGHVGRDLDGRMWENFGVPAARDINFRPSLTLETFAHYFSCRLIEKLEDAALMTAFDRLSDAQPAEYQVWRRLRQTPIEEVRKMLLRTRAGLDGTFWVRDAN